MRTINEIKHQLDNDNTGDILPLLTNVIFGDSTRVKDFSVNNMYYRNDVVLIPHDITNKPNKFFICMYDGVMGEYLEKHWKPYNVSVGGTSIVGTERHIAIEDGISEIPINIEQFNSETGTANINHSVMGKLAFEIDWEYNVSRTAIVFKGFTLYEGESVIVDYFS